MKKSGVLLSLILAFTLCFGASAQAEGMLCDVAESARSASGWGSASPSIVISSEFDDLGGIIIKGKTEQMYVVDSALSLPVDGKEFANYDGFSFGLKYMRIHEFSNRFTVSLKSSKGTFYQRNITSDSNDIVTLNFSGFKNDEGYSIKKSELEKVNELIFQFYGMNRAPAPINVSVAVSDIYGVKDTENFLPIKVKKEKAEKEEEIKQDGFDIPDVAEYIIGAVLFAGALVAVYFIFKKRKKAE